MLNCVWYFWISPSSISLVNFWPVWLFGVVGYGASRALNCMLSDMSELFLWWPPPPTCLFCLGCPLNEPRDWWLLSGTFSSSRFPLPPILSANFSCCCVRALGFALFSNRSLTSALAKKFDWSPTLLLPILKFSEAEPILVMLLASELYEVVF